MKNTAAFLFALLCSLSKLFSQQDSSQAVQSFLPLQVMTFDAKVVSNSVQLQWTVGGNEDAKSFDIERADDGLTFKKVGSKLPAGRDSRVAYEFVDALPKKNTALAYRIKIISRDGASVYSLIESKRIDNIRLQCRLKQNPVRNTVEVEVSSADAGSVHTSVYSAVGQKVQSETKKISAGANLLSLSSQNLLPGLYRLVLESGGERAVLSFVKE